MTRRRFCDRHSDIDALRRGRAEAASKLDALADAYSRWPHRELKTEMERARLCVDYYDAVLSELST
jgi:hypothetical protein